MDKSQAVFIALPFVVLLIAVMYFHLDFPLQIVLFRAEKRMRTWTRTTGTIKGLDSRRGSRAYTWTLIYEFRDEAGNQISRRTVFPGSREIAYSTGCGITVLYNPQDPQISRTEIELEKAGFTVRDSDRLKSSKQLLTKLIIDGVVVFLTAVGMCIFDAKLSYTPGAGILYYLIWGGSMIGCGFLKASKFFLSKLE